MTEREKQRNKKIVNPNLSERNENVLSAEKEETVLCYLNPHVKTVHDEEKIILFLSYFCESKITKYE